MTVDRISVSVGDSSLVYGDWGGVNDPGSISRSRCVISPKDRVTC